MEPVNIHGRTDRHMKANMLTKPKTAKANIYLQTVMYTKVISLKTFVPVTVSTPGQTAKYTMVNF